MGECSGIRREVVHAWGGKASAKDGRRLQMEEGLWMQHQPEEEERGDSGQGSRIYCPKVPSAFNF